MWWSLLSSAKLRIGDLKLSMQRMDNAPLSTWPWEKLGSYKVLNNILLLVNFIKSYLDMLL